MRLGAKQARLIAVVAVILLATAGTVAASNADERVAEFNGTDTSHVWSYETFDGFWFSYGTGEGTEHLNLTVNGREVDKNNLVYRTTYTSEKFSYDGWGRYQVTGFLGDKYFAGYSKNDGNGPFSVNKSLAGNDKLSKVLIDSDKDVTRRIGKTLDLKKGYKLRINQIDVSGDQVWIDLYKDGTEIYTATPGSGDTFVYKTNLGGVDNVPVVAVKIDTVFNGQESSIVKISGVFQISDEFKDINDGEYGKMEIQHSNSSAIVMENEESFTLNKDSKIHLFGDTALHVANSNEIRVAPFVETDEPRWTRGTITENHSETTWNARSFNGFWYDIDNDTGTETLTINPTSRTVDSGDLEYSTETRSTRFKAKGWGSYAVTGFLADKYFAGYTANTGFTDQKSLLTEGRLSKILLDSNSERTLHQGRTLPLKQGYELQVEQVDTSGEKAIINLFRNGEKVPKSGGIVDVGDTYVYKTDTGGVNDLPIIAIHVDSVFRGTESSVLVIDSVFQISHNLKKVENGDDYGKLEVDTTTQNKLTLSNPDDVSLNKGDTVNIGGGMKIKVTNTGNLMYAPVAKSTATYELSETDTDTDSEQSQGTEVKPLILETSPNNPRPGQIVYITAKSNGSKVSKVSIKINGDPVGKTGADGKLMFTPETINNFTVTASKKGYYDAETKFTTQRHDFNIDIDEEPVANQNTQATVKGSEGGSLENIEVYLDGEKVGETGHTGSITLNINESGYHTLTFTKKGYNTLHRRIKFKKPGTIEIRDVVHTEPVAGHPTTFNVFVTNTGDLSTTKTITMYVEGKPVNSRTVDLKPGSTETLAFNHTFKATTLGSPATKDPSVRFNNYFAPVTVATDQELRLRYAAVAAAAILIIGIAAFAINRYGRKERSGELEQPGPYTEQEEPVEEEEDT